MFQNYMRSRLGLTQPQRPMAPTGFNDDPYHQHMNPTGWPGHPLNQNTGVMPPDMGMQNNGLGIPPGYGGATLPQPTPFTGAPAPTPIYAPKSTGAYLPPPSPVYGPKSSDGASLPNESPIRQGKFNPYAF